MINLKKNGLTFDDVLLVPQHSVITSRSHIDLSVNLSKGIKLTHPIIVANMQTTAGPEMCRFIAASGGLAILHRFMPIDEQLVFAKEMVDAGFANNFAVSIGVGQEGIKAACDFANLGVKIICVDVAHGDSKLCLETCDFVSSAFPGIFLIAGNVATGAAAQRLWMIGVDAVKVGIGPGSLCSTRVETGNGVPQLTAVSDIHQAKLEVTGNWFNGNILTRKEIKKEIFIIGDGGIKSAGDCVKCLAFTDMVMCGNLFSGTDEAPAEIIEVDGKQYKSYVGSSTHKSNRVEGVSALVSLKGPADKVLTKLKEGIQSGLSYQGCDKLSEFVGSNPQFIKITAAGIHESRPHSVDIITK